MTHKKLCLLAGLCLLTSNPLRATDLFDVSAQSATVNGGTPTVIGDNNLPDLIEKVIKAQDEFAPYQSANFRASLRYASVYNAMTFIVGSGGTTASLNIPITGFSKTFNGATRDDVEAQIKSFLKKDGATELAKFLKAIDGKSAVAVSDGNPGSSTANSAAQSFNSYGMEMGETREEKENPRKAGGSGLGFSADVGRFEADGFKGTTYSLPLYARFKLSDRVGLNFDLPINYTKLEGAQIFGAGIGLGLPIKVIPHAKDSPWFWQVTPSGGAIASGSQDMLAGGLLAQGGFTSLLNYDFKNFSLSMGNQISFFQGIPLEYSDYKFDPNISQQIMKNGLKASIPFGRRWIFEVYGIHTEFLQSAAVDQYFTVGGDLGYRFLGKADSAKKKTGYVKIGLYSQLSDRYKATNAQFGTGWKF